MSSSKTYELSQKNDGEVLQPVAFFFKSMSLAENDYAIYDKELLAIIRNFKEWRLELQANESRLPMEVLIDHQALQYFITTKKLSQR